MTNRQLTILLADADDSVLVETCQSARFEGDLQVVKNLAETSSYLRGESTFTNRSEFPVPNILFLTAGASRAPVLEFLDEHQGLLKKHRIMTFVFGPEISPQEVGEMIDSGAHTYVVLPPTISTMIAMICCLSNWLEHVSFPPKPALMEDAVA